VDYAVNDQARDQQGQARASKDEEGLGFVDFMYMDGTPPGSQGYFFPPPPFLLRSHSVYYS
jgi:hypothetical protein